LLLFFAGFPCDFLFAKPFFGVNVGIVVIFCGIFCFSGGAHVFETLSYLLAISSVAGFYFHIVRFYVGAILTLRSLKSCLGWVFIGENTLCGRNVEGNAISALMTQDIGVSYNTYNKIGCYARTCLSTFYYINIKRLFYPKM